MATDPKIGFKITGTIIDVKGECSAGHQIGNSFNLSCHNPGGLCGYFYHDLFPSLSTFQFGGSMPWWKGDVIEVRCPDYQNAVTMRLTRSTWE
ncbi:MAG: TIGR04076 family protein [Thermodesulfobacteriota bacterium]